MAAISVVRIWVHGRPNDGGRNDDRDREGGGVGGGDVRVFGVA